MKKYESFKSWFDALISAVVALVSPFLYNYLIGLTLNLGGWGELLITIGTSVIFVMIMQSFLDFLLKNSRVLRKLILGRAYFEGTGIDITFDKQSETILYGAMTRYYYCGSQICAESECFDNSGEVIGNFELKTIDYTETALRYGFQGIIQGKGRQNGKYYGYGEMFFGVREGNPRQYYGFYIDNADCKQLFYEGCLIDKKIIKKAEIDEEYKRKLFKEHIDAFRDRKKWTYREARTNKHI